MKRSNIKAITVTALFTAATAVISLFRITMPSGVPLTLQIFAVSLCGCCLPPVYALLSTAVYIIIGALGVPVFSGGGGIASLTGPTAGFIYGFLLLSLFCALSAYRKPAIKVLLAAAGLLLCHLLGAAWYAVYSAAGIWRSFALVSLPYLFKDALLVTAAHIISIKLRPETEKFFKQ